MASVEQQLGELRAEGVTDARLRKGLKSRVGLVVAAAARTIHEQQRTGFHESLAAAFDRLAIDPSKRDPGCHGKTWVARALTAWPHDEVLLKGARLVQLDPAWGPPEDVSTELRCLCALELVGRGNPQAPAILAELLADPATVCQVAGARGVAAWSDPALGALLRLRVLLSGSQTDPELISECLEGLLRLDSDNADWVRGHLDGPWAECALLALAGARQPCLEDIQSWLTTHADPRMRRVGFIALALLRSDEATQELEHHAQWGTPADQKMATEALEL